MIIQELIIMTIAVAIGLSDASQRLIDQWRSVPTRIVEALDDGVQQFVEETEVYIRDNMFRGGPGAGGGQLPIGGRSNDLQTSIKGVRDKPLGGFVGTTRGTTTPYARTILGPGTTTIRPVNAKHLWIPLSDNQTPRGQARYSPRELFETFGDRVKVFRSKKGNLVAFVEERDEAGQTARYQRNITKGRNAGRKAGDAKGKLMFVLKDQVVIQGTDALAKGVQRMGPRGAEILTQHLQRAFPGGGSA